jgi:hypothetical protein
VALVAAVAGLLLFRTSFHRNQNVISLLKMQYSEML